MSTLFDPVSGSVVLPDLALAIPSQWENEPALGAGLFYTLRQSRSPIAVYCVWISRLRHETRGVSAPRIRLGSPKHCDLVTGLAFGLVHVIPIAANSMDCWS